ncbi:hypothetical protein K488DRAFT_89464 [Vararia minispora EC-137]|uniref:Uncharacterized protein n=1 Tax=Vararia minispora EC-137 TaxID=1314806 RepID=A0ACB8QAU7_9AGAM|nr:hypothetical protein K488DRAFT_89464 [Vararia minispora EC-137]
MRSVPIFFIIFILFVAIQVGAGHFVPRQHNEMLVAAEDHPHTATHVHGVILLLSNGQVPHRKRAGSSMTPENTDDVIDKLDDTVADASTSTAAPAISTVSSTNTTPTITPDFSYMASPVYAWGHSLLQKLLPVE